jgi:glycosyltransferase involved in cell wall biosynthesis
VVEVLATLQRAGAERMAVSLARRLDRGRFETSVISLYDAFPNGFEPELKAGAVPALHLGKHRGLDLRMVPRLARAFRELSPAIVHTHSYVLRYAWPAALLAGVPLVVHTVHNLAEREVDRAGRMLQRAVFRLGVVPVAVSTEVGLSFRALYGFDPAAVITNGIDTSQPCQPGDWRGDHGFSPGDLLVVSVARLEPQKDPLALVDSFARVTAPRCHLLLAGGGSLAETVREHAVQLGVADRVHLLGVQLDIAPLLAAADIFALASRWEGHPMAVMEATAAGLPVVATAVGGVPEIVEDGATGLLVPPGDPARFAAALDALAADPAMRRRFSEAAVERAGRFGVERMVAAYAGLFERLAGGRT